MADSSAELYRWYELLRHREFVLGKDNKIEQEFIDVLGEDLNCWSAITLLRQYYKKQDAEALGQGMELLGVLHEDWIKNKDCPIFKSRVNVDETFVEKKIAERLQFIHQKNWAEADRIRDELTQQNIILKDGKDPTTGERVTHWETRN